MKAYLRGWLHCMHGYVAEDIIGGVVVHFVSTGVI